MEGFNLDALGGFMGPLSVLLVIAALVVLGFIAIRKGSGVEISLGGQKIKIGESVAQLVSLQSEQYSRHQQIEDSTHADLDRLTRNYKGQIKLVAQELLSDPVLSRVISAESREVMRDRVRDNNFLTRFAPDAARGYLHGLVAELVQIWDDETEHLQAGRPKADAYRAPITELVTRLLYDIAARCAEDCDQKISMYQEFSERFKAAGAPLQAGFCEGKITKKKADRDVFRARPWG